MGSRLGLTLALVVVFGAARAAGQASIVPEWVGRDAETLRGHREGTLPGAEALYTAAAATPAQVDGPIEHALLLCHVSVSDSGPRGRWDTFADPDLRIELRTGRFHGTAWGTENSMQAWVSFADVGLRPRQSIEVRLWDRDVTGDERIDTLRTSFAGAFPVTLEHGTSRVSCALGDPAQAARETTALLAAAETSLAEVEAAQPSLGDPALGRPLTSDGNASGHIAAAMAWSGLREPRAVALRDRLDAARAAFDRALVAAVRTARETRTEGATPIAGTSASVRIVGTLSSPRAVGAAYPDMAAPMPSAIEVELEPASADASLVLGVVDYVDTSGATFIGTVVRSPTTPGRVGIAFSARLRGGVLRVGGNPRTVLVHR